MPKQLKYFSNGRGFNYFPDFPDRFPGGSKVLTGELPYTATNNVHAFWRYYDEDVIESTIQKLRWNGVNNIRVWFDYYQWNHYKTLPDDQNPYVQRIKHLVRTLESNCMYCCWVFFDGLMTPQFEPFPGLEHLEINTWKYFPASSVARQATFMDNLGIPYIEDMSRLTSGSQASFLYEFGNELKIFQFTSGNIVKGVSAMYRCTSANPNIKRGLGVVLQHPFYGLTGTVGVGADLDEQYLIHLETTGLDLLTVHPYTNFDRARSIQVDFALSAGYDLDTPVFFTEGAYALAFNSHIDWMNWCEASSLGWSLFQAFSPSVSGTVYRDIVGLWHSDMEIRLSSAVSEVTGLAVRSGYKENWLQRRVYKTEYASDAETISTYWTPPKGSPQSPLASNWLPDTSPYYSRYRLGGLEQELDEDVPISFHQNWETSTIALSAVRALYATEILSNTHFNEEYRLQTGTLGILGDFVYFAASGWGLNNPIPSSYFSQWNLTNTDYNNIMASSREQAIVAYPGCVANGPSEGVALCDGTCYYGPNCVGGVFQNNGLDFIDYNAYTAWHKRLRDFNCHIGNKIGLFSCVGIP